ncbi:uncharacterized protein LOC122860436 [Aphidius gifuensis]|uniref:uncharacterized protein LOC122860436 n=1 Tax=Aphidius gifuensis TaxID=684658 RepID=UPI001CDD4A13|nr:uncharacterized protein LOC122860436 [Aphidius gifuensis]
MNAKKICVEKDQQISDDGDKDPKVVINSLDYDSLAKIIMLLPIPERIDMEKVCTKWKEACQIAWYDIKKYKCESSIGRCYDNRLLTQSYLEKILSRCGNYLKELSLSYVCNSSIMPFVGDHCKNLTTLECKFNDNSLIEHFIQAFIQLDKLKCIKITVDHNYLNETINFSAISNSLPEEINEIHLFSKPLYCQKQDISMSLQRFRNLQKFTLVGLCLDNINLQEIALITTLVYLKIELYNDHMYIPLILFNKLVNLEYIDLTLGIWCDLSVISTEVLETIFCTCKNLKHLYIPFGSYDVVKIPLKKWINRRNLQHLGIACNIMPDLASTIVEYCKNLKHLKIQNANRLMNETALKKLTELENLESLSLVYNIMLSEESIIAISNNCKKLKRLEIPDSVLVPSIDGEPLSSPSVLDELSNLQYLEHLNLHKFIYLHEGINLEDSTIIAIANNCKNLKILQIQNHRNITERGLVALKNLKNLQKLDVTSLNITDDFIIKLKGLKKLRCSKCQKLTNAGIIQFIKNNPDLEVIDVSGIKNITIDLIIAADHATKNRMNGTILHLTISVPSIKLSLTKPTIKSQWLAVKYL